MHALFLQADGHSEKAQLALKYGKDEDPCNLDGLDVQLKEDYATLSRKPRLDLATMVTPRTEVRVSVWACVCVGM
jgi:hypothetical protein